MAYSFLSPVVICIDLVGLTVCKKNKQKERKKKGSLNLLQMTSAAGRRADRKKKKRKKKKIEARGSASQRTVSTGNLYAMERRTAVIFVRVKWGLLMCGRLCVIKGLAVALSCLLTMI